VSLAKSVLCFLKIEIIFGYHVGTYARASLTYREQIKNWDIKFEDLFRILAHLIEEDDATLYDLLRIFYMVAPRWFDRKKVILLHPNKRNLLETVRSFLMKRYTFKLI
jgi:hypothetical protein